ncbi:MAG: DUF6088 family protein [Elusimicrobiota bacterium]
MDAIQTRIFSRIRRLGPRKVHASKDFLDLGSRMAVDQALSRLAKAKTIKRFCRGIYFLPKLNRALGIELAPDMDELAQALARKTGSRIVPSGAVAANWLGLSTQVPAKPVYLTDGRTRTVRAGNLSILIKHTPPKDFPLGSPTSAMVFQALRYLGKDAINAQTIVQIRRRLSGDERRKLVKDIRYTTDWLAEAVRKVCDG